MSTNVIIKICNFHWPFCLRVQVYGDKDEDGFYWGEASGRSGYVPCNMVSEVQVDDERLAQELLKEEDRPPGETPGTEGAVEPPPGTAGETGRGGSQQGVGL